MSKIYQYKPLADGHIRLLYLWPGKNTAAISLLRVVKLDDAPPFEALSYCWGSTELTHSIEVNGKALNITHNLNSALLRIRHETETKVLWADAICINQHDIEERTKQVQLMAIIYGRASQVLIHLGRVTGDLSAAVQLIFNICDVLEKEARGGGTEQLPVTEYPLVETSEMLGLPPVDSSDWDHLVRFFECAWFERVWIIQEVRVASNAVVLIDDYEIPWKSIHIATIWLLMRSVKHPVAGKSIDAGFFGHISLPYRIGCHRSGSNASFRVPLNQIIRDTRPTIATDPRDKIFGLLGLAVEAEGNHDMRLKADYSKSLERVYRDTSRFLIETERSLQILSAVCWVSDSHSSNIWKKASIEQEHETETFSRYEGSLPDENVVFPSWVPRWDCPDFAHPLVDKSNPDEFFHASGDVPLSLMMSSDQNALIVRGLEIDVVKDQSDTLSSNLLGYEPYQTTLSETWLEMGSEARMYPEADRLDIFHLTLTAGLAGFDEEAESNADYQADVQAFRARMPNHRGKEMQPHSGDDDEPSGHSQDTVERHSDLAVSEGSESVAEEDATGDADRYLRHVQEYGRNRKFFITEEGRMGLGPKGILPGDTVCILFGGDTPYVLRKKDKCWQFIGECYVHGIMKGEAVRDLKGGVDEGEVFEIR
ncbi:hypothetical protein VTL71DRAFT_15304 [Oculimacula yallundae]|uniref:Heterokaryon incompatibility domain-containing protein n=1 Tax=Oculimacula yallundae TaxID=86028 RepID=A0ABR4CG62_9HELO